MKYLALGARIRSLRKSAGMSLAALAKATGLPEARLARFELDEEQPLIAHLIQISKALKVNVADIFRDRPQKKNFEIIRTSKRQKIRPLLEPTRHTQIFDYTYELLSSPSEEKHMNAYMIELAPHEGKSPHDDLTHAGEEFLYVIEGKIDGEIDGEAFILEVGDSIYLRSTQTHRFYNSSDRVARAIAVVYPF